MKKYRVNESEHFNLYSMYDHLKCMEIDMEEAPAHTYAEKQWNELYERISEVESLMEKAYCVGATVDWPTLKRIREIKAERQMIRYSTCMAQGTPEREAAALGSMMYGGFEDRRRYEAALTAITDPEKREKFISEWQDGHSSLNDIGTYCHELAKRLKGLEVLA